MSKTKTKKIKELKSDQPEKITNEELNQVQSVINNINRAQLEIGSFESKKHNILHHISILQGELSKIESEFEKIYGTTDINIQDGTINQEKNEQTN